MKVNNLIDVFRSKIFLLFETISLILLPVVILTFKPEILHYRTQLFIAGFIYILYLFIVEKLTFSQFGITTNNFIESVKAILPITIIIFAVLITSIFFKYDSRFLFIDTLAQEAINGLDFRSIINTVLISSALQEIIFRGFYITRLELVSQNKFFLVLLSSLVFAIIHTPFKNDVFTAGTFFIGILYSLNFIKYRNIFGIIISHAILLGGLTLTLLF